jgi:hypothetical protein
MKNLAADVLKTVGLYLVVVVGGVLSFLSLAPVFGYLPYSDRPGPGWFGRFPAVSWAEFWRGASFHFGWSVLLLPYAAISGLMLLLVVRVLERFRTPRVLVAVVGALFGGFVSGYIVLGIGWYIAIAAAPVYVAMVLGFIFGAWLLPRKRARVEQGV